MAKVNDVYQRSPGVRPHLKAEARQVGHVLQPGRVLEISRRIDPQGDPPIAPQFPGQRFATRPVEPEGIEKDVQLVGRQASFDQILEEVGIDRRAQPGQAPQALLKDEWHVQVVTYALIEQALIVHQHRDLGARRAVELRGEHAQLLKALQQGIERRLLDRVDV